MKGERIITGVYPHNQPNTCTGPSCLFAFVRTIVPSCYNGIKAVKSVFKLENQTIKLSQGSTPIINPMLVHYLPALCHMFSVFYLVATIV